MCIDNAVFVPYNQVEKGQKPSKGEHENAIVSFKIKDTRILNFGG